MTLLALSSSASPFLDLPSHLLDLLLAHLPLRAALSASSSCKSLYALVSSPPFSRLHSLLPSNRHPWFFFFGLNLLLPSKNQTFAFDPLSRSWSRLPFSSPPPHNSSSLSAMNGVLFGLAGAKQTQLCLNTRSLKPQWKVTSPMQYSRCGPLVGVVENSGTSSFSVIVAGGADDCDDCMAVELYDATTDRWQRCPSLPESLGQSCAHLSSAIYKGKFYVADRNSETLCAFDVEKKVWTSGECMRPQGVFLSSLVACENGLVMAGLCNCGTGSCVKVWKVEETSMASKELGTMPPELFALFGEDEEQKQIALKFAGGGNWLYIYSESKFKDYAVCLCELGSGDGGCVWTKLPPLPPPVNRFDRVICSTSTVSLDVCFPRSA